MKICEILANTQNTAYLCLFSLSNHKAIYGYVNNFNQLEHKFLENTEVVILNSFTMYDFESLTNVIVAGIEEEISDKDFNNLIGVNQRLMDITEDEINKGSVKKTKLKINNFI